MITKKQHKLLQYIIDYQKNTGGLVPSYRDMATAILDKPYPGPIHGMVNKLIHAGFLEREEAGAWRALKVLKNPDGSPPINNVMRLDALGLRLVATNTVPEGELWVRPSDAQKITA